MEKVVSGGGTTLLITDAATDVHVTIEVGMIVEIASKDDYCRPWQS